MKTAVALLLGTGLSLVSGAALAQQQWGGTYQAAPPPARTSGLDNIGEEWQFVFGVDRVMGFSWDRDTTTGDVAGTEVESTEKSTTLALFGTQASSFTNFPRLGLDFFVIESVSLGGSLVYWRSSGEREIDPDPGGGSGDLPTRSFFTINPRVGYAYAFDETFSIWPRLGITYFNANVEDEDGDEATWSGWDLTGEVLFGISPMSNFAILVGPYLDLGLSGSAEEPDGTGGTMESDFTHTSFGLMVSIVGYY